MSGPFNETRDLSRYASVAQALIDQITIVNPREQARTKGIHYWPTPLPVPDPLRGDLTLFLPENAARAAIASAATAPRTTFTALSLSAQVAARSQFPPSDLVMMAPIGLVDIPESQRQEVLWIDLHGAEGPLSGGPVLVAGMQGSGKATLLQQMLLWFAARYPARQFRAIVVDPTRDLESFQMLPHLRGDDGQSWWAEGDEPDQIKAVVEYGDRLVAARRAAFPGERWDASSVPRLQEQGHTIPFHLLVLSQFHTMDGRRDNAAQQLKELALRWNKVRAMGFYTILSTEEVNSRIISTDLMARIGTKIGFFLNDQPRYDLFGCVAFVPEPLPGRGLVMTRDRAVHEMQTALPVTGRTERARIEHLDQEIQWLAAQDERASR